MAESLTFNILANDLASRPLRNVADSADLAAKGALLLATSLDAQKKAANVSAGATLTLAKADQLLGKAAGFLATDAAASAKALQAQGNAAAAAAVQVTAAKDAEVALAIDAAAATAALKAQGDAAVGTAAKMATLNAMTIGGGKGLGTHIALFGGGPSFVPMILKSVTAMHLLADSALEAAAVIVPATIAFGAFAAAAAPAAMDVYHQMQALNTASKALGQQMPGLSGGFSKVAAAVRPQVYELFGEALHVANQDTGTFMTLATGAGRVLDQLGARAAVALGSHGMSMFISGAVKDLAMLGTIGGNVLGTLGNLLKTMPGYAEMLFHGIADVTGALEHLTSSSVAQGVIHLGLGFHGAVLWGGLLGTTVGKLVSGGLTGLASVGLKAGIGLEKIAGGSSTASEGMAKFAGFAEKASGLPWGWIAAAGIGLGVLVYHLVTAKDAMQQWIANVQNAVAAMSGGGHGYNALVAEGATLTDRLALAQKDMAAAAAQGSTATNRASRSWQFGNPLLVQAKQNIADLTSAITINQDQVKLYDSRLNLLSSTFHMTRAQVQGLIAEAGVPMSQMLTKNKNALDQIIVAVDGANRAYQEMGVQAGRLGAADNALTSNFMTNVLPVMQKVTQAEDAVISVITGGRSSFIAFEQGMQQMGKDSHVAGASLTGLNKVSLTLASDFYTTVVPAGQKLISSLQQQGISTRHLTTAVADEAKQMLGFAGHSAEARAVVVALINNALGPGTVSLRTLNKWVEQNSGSLKGFSAIVGASTIKAGEFAGVLQKDLTAQFRADLLVSSGATGAMKRFTDAITHGGTQTQAYHGARAKLISDLEATGLSARSARTFVNNLQASVNKLHGKNVNVGLTTSGSGKIIITGTGIATHVINTSTGQVSASGGHTVAPGGAAGMLVRGGTPGRDSVLVNTMPGELIVPTKMVQAGAVDHLRGKIPGFAAGGLVGGAVRAENAIGLADVQVGSSAAVDLAKAAAAAARAAAAAAAAAAGAAGGPATGGPAAAQAYARSRLAAYGWGPGQMPPLIALWNQESGWNRFARNPTSGAYGIPQALPPSKMGAAANPPTSSMAAQVNWGLGYIRGRYGSPAAAEAHELAYRWYDQGGYLPTGLSLAYNGTGRPEPVIPAGRGGAGVTVNVTVNVPPTVNPRQAGQEIAEVHKAHLRGGGSLYPAGMTPR